MVKWKKYVNASKGPGAKPFIEAHMVPPSHLRDSRHLGFYDAIRRAHQVNPSYGDIITKKIGVHDIKIMHVKKHGSNSWEAFLKSYKPADGSSSWEEFLKSSISANGGVISKEQLQRPIFGPIETIRKVSDFLKDEPSMARENPNIKVIMVSGPSPSHDFNNARVNAEKSIAEPVSEEFLKNYVNGPQADAPGNHRKPPNEFTVDIDMSRDSGLLTEEDLNGMAKELADEIDKEIEADLLHPEILSFIAKIEKAKQERKQWEENNLKKLKEYFDDKGNPIKPHLVALMVRKGSHDVAMLTAFTGMGFAFYHDREWPCLVRRKDDRKFPLRGDIRQYIVMYCEPNSKDPYAIFGRSFRCILTQEEFEQELNVVAMDGREISICHSKAAEQTDFWDKSAEERLVEDVKKQLFSEGESKIDIRVVVELPTGVPLMHFLLSEKEEIFKYKSNCFYPTTEMKLELTLDEIRKIPACYKSPKLLDFQVKRFLKNRPGSKKNLSIKKQYSPSVPMLRVRQIAQPNEVMLFLPSEQEKAVGFAMKFNGVKVAAISCSPEEVTAWGKSVCSNALFQFAAGALRREEATKVKSSKKYIEIKRHDGSSYIQPWDKIGEAIDGELDCIDDYPEITITFKRSMITDEAYEKLPDFAGH